MSTRKGEKTNWNGELTLSKNGVDPDSWGYARKLKEVGRALHSIVARKDLACFLTSPKHAQELGGLVEDVRDALMEYQVCTAGALVQITSNVHLRNRYNETLTTRIINPS